MRQTPPDVQERIDATRPFEDWYISLEDGFSCVLDTPSQETRSLVKSDYNAIKPIHRWYNVKEAFDAELPAWLCQWMIDHYNHTPINICEPFLGGGTTGVRLASPTRTVVGVEYNPFIRFVAATKAAVSQVNPDELEQAINSVARVGSPRRAVPIPALTTLHNADYCSAADVQFLLRLLDRIRELGSSPVTRAILCLGVGAALEDVFQLRKDGRALRYIPKPDRPSPRAAVGKRWQAMLDDVREYHQEQQPAQDASPLYQVYGGSAVCLNTLTMLDGTGASLANDTFDTVIYSPPYANDFDYSEIYKLELWMLGFLDSYEAWTRLRRGTIRSHRSVTFQATHHLAEDTRTREIAARIQEMVESPCLPDNERARVRRLIEGYFDDMYSALCEQWRVLRPGGVMAYVVANSRHYYLPLATDLILAEIARRVGFEPLELIVLEKRNGRTRQKQFLRESAVFFRKPDRQRSMSTS